MWGRQHGDVISVELNVTLIRTAARGDCPKGPALRSMSAWWYYGGGWENKINRNLSHFVISVKYKCFILRFSSNAFVISHIVNIIRLKFLSLKENSYCPLKLPSDSLNHSLTHWDANICFEPNKSIPHPPTILYSTPHSMPNS